METAETDRSVGFPILFAIVAVLGALGLAVFGFTGEQIAAGWSFGLAMFAGALSVAAYHVYA